jgi:GT2 family glycosyltransferase
MNDLKVSIVIPNWNGSYLMSKHLRNLIKVSENAEIVVSDDNSNDDSVKFLKTNFPEVNVIQRLIRTGFAGNVNSGVAHANGDIVVLINTDVEPEPGYLKPLLNHFADPKVFAVGCMDKSYEKGEIKYRGRGIARWEHGFYLHERGDIDKTDTAWVSGGSGAFRREYWNKLGGMDELFNPFYWEDIDLSYRGVRAGYTIIFEPKSLVNHYHEEGKIKSDFSPGQVKLIAYRNQFTFILKHIPDFKMLLEHIVYAPYRIIKSLISGDCSMAKGYLAATLRIPRIIYFRLKYPDQI